MFRIRIILKLAGLALVALYFTDHPLVFQPEVVALYLIIFLTITLLHVFIVKPVVDELKRSRQRLDPQQYAESERRAIRARFHKLFSQFLRRPALNLLLAIGEDGLFLVPLLWFGIEPLSALVVAVGFAALHYPKYSALQCASKALAYYLVCMLVLPHGLLNVLIGHLLLDACFLSLAWQRTQRHRELYRDSIDA